MARATIPWTPTSGDNSSPYEGISAEQYLQYLRMYGKYNSQTKGYDSTEDLDRWFKWYSGYLQKISPYQGTEYYQQLLNNPYASFQQWKGDPFQTIGNAITGSGSNTFYNSREAQADEELQRILGLMQENTHNSTVSQVARDRAAGINDTLSGSIAGDTPAASMPTDGTGPSPGPELTDMNSIIQSMAGLTSGFITGCVSLAKSFNELGILNTARKSGKVDLAEKMKNLMLDTEASKMPAPTKSGDKYDFSNALDGLVAAPKLGLEGQPESLKASRTTSRAPMFKDKGLQRMYNRMRGTVAYDEEGKPTVALQRAYKRMYADSAQDTYRAAESFSHPGFDPDDVPAFGASLAVEETGVINAIRSADLGLRKIQQRVQSSQARSAEAQANYDEAVLTTETGQAEAANRMDEFDLLRSQREVNRLKAEFNKSLETARNNLMQKCSGNVYAQVLLPGLLTTLDGVGGRVLDHFDGFIDMLINPVGKALGQGLKGLTGVGMNKGLSHTPVPTP